MLCTCNKLASSQQVFHPLFTENRNATNQSWRISTWCIRHFLPVLLSSEVLRCNSQIVIPIFCCWYGNATTVSDVFCLFVVYMYTKHVTYQLRIFSFYNYSRTPLVCFICIKQTVTVAVLYFFSPFSPFLTISLCRAGQYLSHPVFSVLCHVFSQSVFLHVALYVVPPSLSRSASAPSPRDL